MPFALYKQTNSFMRKMTFIVVASLITTFSAWAQQPAGTFAVTPKVGFSLSDFSGKMALAIGYAIDRSTPISEPQMVENNHTPLVGAVGFNDRKSKMGPFVGLEVQYQITPVFGISLGTFYTRQGAKYKTKGFEVNGTDGVMLRINDDINVNLHGISIPLLANAYIWKGLSLKAGIQPEFFLSKKVDADVTLSYDGTTIHAYPNFNDDFKSFALSIPVGIAYEYRNFVADLRYSFGVTDVNDVKDVGKNSFSDTAHNRVLSFTLGYQFLW